MKNTRCEEVIVQLVVRTYDDAGRPIREQVSQAAKVFRNAETRDFWSVVDHAVGAMEQQAAAPPSAAPTPLALKKGRGRA